MKKTETPKEQKTDTSAEGGAEDIFDSIVSAHLGALDQIAAKIPPADTVTGAQLIAAIAEIKAMVSVTIATVVPSAIAASTAQITHAVNGELATALSANDEEKENRLLASMDVTLTRIFQALAADIAQDRADNKADRQTEAAERKQILTALTQLMKPRKRTGTVTLPSGKVEMVVSETVQ